MKRFWSKVNKTRSRATCWLWNRKIRKDGYANFWANGKLWLAHRFAYSLLRGTPPPFLDHLCRVRHCINPWHLEDVTRRLNILRGNSFAALNAKKTHCKHGHPFDKDNTRIRIYKGGAARDCRTCNRLRYPAKNRRGPQQRPRARKIPE